MRRLGSDLICQIERWVAPPGTSVDDRRKRAFIFSSSLILVPMILVFAAEDYRQGSYLECCAVTALAIFLMALPFILAKVGNCLPIFRLGALQTLILQTYEIESGGGNGFSFLWFYCFPLLALALFGQREGAAWSVAAVLLAAAAFVTPIGYSYEIEVGLRFLVSYTLVALFSYGLEASRERLYSQLLEEKVALEDALAQIKTLRGLLPICGGCKKIRDDQGYWQQIEDFVGEHSQAEFSHGVCPSCTEKFYPGLVLERLESAES